MPCTKWAHYKSNQIKMVMVVTTNWRHVDVHTELILCISSDEKIQHSTTYAFSYLPQRLSGSDIFLAKVIFCKFFLFISRYQITTKTKVNFHVEFYPPCSQSLSKLLRTFTSSNATRLNSNRDERKARRLSSSPSAPGIKTLCV